MSINDIKNILDGFKSEPCLTILNILLLIVVILSSWFLRSYLSQKGKNVANEEHSSKSGIAKRKEEILQNAKKTENSKLFLTESSDNQKQKIDPPIITLDKNLNILGGEDAIQPIVFDLIKRVESGNRPFFFLENRLIKTWENEISSLSGIKKRTGKQNRYLASLKQRLDYQIEQNSKFEKCIDLIITNPSIVNIKKYELKDTVPIAIEGIHDHLYKATFINKDEDYYDFHLTCELNLELLYNKFKVTRDQWERMIPGKHADGRPFEKNEHGEFPLYFLDENNLFFSALPLILLNIVNDSSNFKNGIHDMTK